METRKAFWIAFVAALLLAVSFVTFQKGGWHFMVSSLSLLFIAVTMLARGNDLRIRKGWHWYARLAGFMLSGVAPFGIIGYEWYAQAFPSFYEVMFRFGLSLVFFTTPYLPPYWKWISGWTGEDILHSDDRRLK